MNPEHVELAEGRWFSLSLIEQMAHIGGEVERVLLWQERGNADHSRRAYERALELLGLSITHVSSTSSVRELTRLREALTDWFVGVNEFGSTPTQWRSYFNHFALACRRDR